MNETLIYLKLKKKFPSRVTLSNFNVYKSAPTGRKGTCLVFDRQNRAERVWETQYPVLWGDLNLEYEEVASSVHTSNVWKALESDSDGECEGHVNTKQGAKAEGNRLTISRILTYFTVIFNF